MEAAQRGSLDMGSAEAPARPTPLQTVGMIIVVIILVAGYLTLGSVLGIRAPYMGFLFATYWGGIKLLAPAEFVPTVCGALVGIALAYLFYSLPGALGTPGLLLALAATIGTLYGSMRQHLPLFLNPSFLVFVTVATIPALTAQHDYLGLVVGMLYGAIYARTAVFALAWLAALRSPRREPTASPAGSVP